MNGMTCKDMIPAIGAKVAVRFESLTVVCEVRDVKMSWGKPRLLVVPVSGVGEQWVELSRIIVQSSRETSYMIAR
jgi:hypothetical protein